MPRAPPGPLATRLAQVAENMGDALLVVGREGRVMFANAQCERLFGRASGELAGTEAEGLLPKRLRPRLRELQELFFSQPHPRTLGPEAGVWGLAKDGSEFPVEVSVSSQGPKDDPWAILVIRDATLHQRVLRAQRLLADVSGALASSLDFEATLAQATHMAVPELADWCLTFLADGDGKVRRVEIAQADLSKADLLAQLQHLCPPVAGHEAAVSRVLRSGRSELYPEPSQGLENALSNGNSECSEALRQLGMESAVLAPLRGHDRALGVLALVSAGSGRRYGAEDVHLAEELGRRAGLAVDHALLHREIQAAEARYRSLFEGAQDPIFVLDGEARLVDANPAAVALLGYPPEQLLGLRLDDPKLVARPEELRSQLDSLRHEGGWRGEVDLRGQDGVEVPLEVRATRVDSPQGKGFVVIAREISERRALERMQRDFIALVTHELRNPLSVVKGYAQLMQRTGATSGRGLAAIIAQVNHMDRLVNDLLEASRIEAGRLELRRSRIDLVSLVRACCDQAQAITRLHTVRLETGEAAVAGWWDRDRIEQVLQNLLTNAIKYSPEGGEIAVRLEVGQDGTVLVSVRDRGIGIPISELPRLFRRFFRVEGSASVAKGLGLGLYVSRSLVEAHGGRIWAEAAPDKGTVFCLTLPQEPGLEARAVSSRDG